MMIRPGQIAGALRLPARVWADLVYAEHAARDTGLFLTPIQNAYKFLLVRKVAVIQAWVKKTPRGPLELAPLVVDICSPALAIDGYHGDEICGILGDTSGRLVFHGLNAVCNDRLSVLDVVGGLRWKYSGGSDDQCCQCCNNVLHFLFLVLSAWLC